MGLISDRFWRWDSESGPSVLFLVFRLDQYRYDHLRRRPVDPCLYLTLDSSHQSLSRLTTTRVCDALERRRAIIWAIVHTWLYLLQMTILASQPLLQLDGFGVSSYGTRRRSIYPESESLPQLRSPGGTQRVSTTLRLYMCVGTGTGSAEMALLVRCGRQSATTSVGVGGGRPRAGLPSSHSLTSGRRGCRCA